MFSEFVVTVVHVLTAMLWIGLVGYASLFTGPWSGPGGDSVAVRAVRAGWLCLPLLAATGTYLLYFQGVTLASVASGELFHGRFGGILRAKFIIVAMLLVVQILAPRLDRTGGRLIALLGVTGILISAYLVR